jgi:tRNA threonylcarbamoyladenosine biosynthesis protein TsaB
MVAIDARHDNVYMQVFGAGGRSLLTPRVVTLREAARAATSGPARIVGSGAELVVRAWPRGAPPPVVVDQRPAPDIAWIARLGAVASAAEGPPKPLYLRPPDAQPQLAGRLPRR